MIHFLEGLAIHSGVDTPKTEVLLATPRPSCWPDGTRPGMGHRETKNWVGGDDDDDDGEGVP